VGLAAGGAADHAALRVGAQGAQLHSPLLVVHGADDSLIRSELGRRLYEAATGRKQFLLVEGGSHHSTMTVGQAQYRTALAQLFKLN
jgi:pimeloyl-ACP methyl ester carboxylesterase